MTSSIRVAMATFASLCFQWPEMDESAVGRRWRNHLTAMAASSTYTTVVTSAHDSMMHSSTEEEEGADEQSQLEVDVHQLNKSKSKRPTCKKMFRCVLLFFPLIIPFVAYVKGTDPDSQILLILFIVVLIIVFSCVLTALLKIRARLADRASRRELSQHHVFAITNSFLPLTLPYRTYERREGISGGSTPPPYYCINLQTVTAQPDFPPSYEEALRCPSPPSPKNSAQNDRYDMFESPPPTYDSVVK